MTSTRSLWIAESLLSLAALAAVYSQLATWRAVTFVVAELGLFVIAFVATLLSDAPGKVLVAGVGLGLACATLLAIVAPSSGCSESDIICFDDPGLLFVIGLIGAGALYPGWALGTGLGALARLARG
jgi:hypothetical protein